MARLSTQRPTMVRMATTCDGTVPDDCGPDLDLLVEMAALEGASRAAGASAASLGAAWRGLLSDFARLETCFTWGRTLRGAAASCAADPAALLELRGVVIGAVDVNASDWD